MKAEESAKRIRAALRAELKRAFGRVGEIHDELSRSHGYLNRYCRGEGKLSVDLLLKSLELMGVDAGLFFANALGAPVARERALEALEVGGKVLAGLAKMKKAAQRLEPEEVSGPEAPPASEAGAGALDAAALDAAALDAGALDAGALDAAALDAGLVAEIVACGVREQQRRLAKTEKYRTAAFARGYLEYLDSLRYDQPKVAASSAQAAAVHLIPAIPCGRREALELELQAIGVYASARRMTGAFATAAEGLLFALELARKQGLTTVLADLLLRASALLCDHALFAQALSLLDEAQLLYFDLESEVDIARVLVNRGIIFNYQGQYDDSVRCLERALVLLVGDTAQVDRNRVAAYQVLSLTYLNLEDTDRAESALARAFQAFKSSGSLNWAKLLWQQGSVAFARGLFSAAETRLESARELLDRKDGPAKALVSIELTRVLFAQGKLEEAVEMAKSMAEFLQVFRKNDVAVAAISRFLKVVLSGNLAMSSIERLKKKLQNSCDLRVGSGRSALTTPSLEH